ncbi:methyl-accepting chemotaxis protein [Magnetococcus sp. PR-3]|uniref:methyl-accepting chemotaxis protein n=1 Tax=Magnetococcus sp. PR-3 TaxID=3120355 RepID=UPI002FCE196B
MLSFITHMQLRRKLLITYLIMAFVTAITGMAGIHYTDLVGHHGTEVGIKLAPLGDAAMEVKLTATEAHLLIEEILSGDTTENIDEAWSLLDASSWYANAIINGGKNDEGHFHPTEDPRVVAKMQEVQKKLITFRTIAQERFDAMANTQVTGSGVDQSFDAQYESLQTGIDALISHPSATTHPTQQLKAALAKYYLADAHLFLEELLAGDEAVKIQEVLAQFSQAEQLLQKTEQPWSEAKNAQLSQTAKMLKTTANTRYKQSLVVMGAGSSMDQKFDATFEAFINSADQAEEFVHSSMDEGMARVEAEIQTAKKILFMVTVVAISIAIALAFMVARSVVDPIMACASIASRIAKGDLTCSMKLGRKDEIGELADALDHMTDNLAKLVHTLVAYATELGGDASKLSNLSLELTDGSSHLNNRSNEASEATRSVFDRVGSIVHSSETASQDLNTIASAAEEMSVNMSTITSAVEEASTNLTMVAGASEEANNTMRAVQDTMNQSKEGVNQVASAIEGIRGTLNDIRAQCQTTAGDSQESAQHAEKAAHILEGLKDSTQNIGKVIAIINDIADQTNMLALNASIEAAGAGEAGKGFAVVANEVKELASQTSDATQTIAQNIEAIQQGSNEAYQASNEMLGRIRRISHGNDEIAFSIDTQYTTLDGVSSSIGNIAQQTNEVADRMEEAAQRMTESSTNLSEVSQGINEVTRNVSEISHAVSEVTQGVAKASHGSGTITENVNHVADNTKNLQTMVTMVEQTAEQFSEISSSVKNHADHMANIGVGLNQTLTVFQLEHNPKT